MVHAQHTYTHLFSNILENYIRDVIIRHAQAIQTMVWLSLTDDRSVIELLVPGRCAQTQTAPDTGDQRREQLCSRSTHWKHRAGLFTRTRRRWGDEGWKKRKQNYN